MWWRWWRAWKAWREEAAVRRKPIPEDLWKRTLVRYPFLQRRDARDAAQLRRMTSLFLDRKEFSATGGLRLSDAMVVSIAAQAVLPVLRLGLHRYDGFVGIVVHPDQVSARREWVDEDGIAHEVDEVLSGEAMPGGPVMLSWLDVRGAGQTASQGYNVVIHEFAHVLDMADGVADGVPQLPPHLPLAHWRATLTTEFQRFVRRVQAAEPTVLDAYGAQSEEEFFAVASESFFVDPARMNNEHPALYGMLARYYGQDPAQDRPAPRRSPG
jgi:Mlc titration factor MtfA (ptsG expression regulator)